MTSRRGVWILTLFVVAVLGIGPISTWLLRNEIRRSMGIATKIDGLTIKRTGNVWLAPGLSLAEIGKSSEAGVRCARAWFQISWSSLLSRHLVFKQLLLEKAELKTPTDRLPQVDLTEQLDYEGSKLPEHFFQSPSNDNWSSLLKDLHIQSVSQSLESNWNQSLSEIENQVATIEESIAKMKGQTLSLDNPLRDIQTLQASNRAAKQLRQQLPKIENDIDEQRDDIRACESVLDEAMAQDKVLIDERLHNVSSHISLITEAFSHRLISQQLESMRKFGELGSSAISLSEIDPAGSRRGRDFFLNETQSTPAWEIENIVINGLFAIDSQRLPFSGRIEHMVPANSVSGRPTTARFRIVRDEQDIFVKARRLIASPSPIDTIDINVVNAPNSTWQVRLPQLQLMGTGGNLSTSISWERADRVWKCLYSFRNSQVSLSVASPDFPSNQDLVDQINVSLTDLSDLEINGSIQVDDEGKITSTLQSNLNQSLDIAFEKAISRTLSSHQAEVNERYQTLYGNTWNLLRSQVDARNIQLRDKVEQMRQEIDDLSTELTARIDPRNDDRFSRTPTPNRIDR